MVGGGCCGECEDERSESIRRSVKTSQCDRREHCLLVTLYYYYKLSVKVSFLGAALSESVFQDYEQLTLRL